MFHSKHIFGAHMSIAGGPHLALVRGQAAGCQAIAIFSASPRIWKRPVMNEDSVDLFYRTQRETGINIVVMHALYLANPATPDVTLQNKSIIALSQEIKFCMKLGIRDLVIHPGSHRGTSVRSGIFRAAMLLDECVETGGGDVNIVLETTSGAQNTIGNKISQLRDIIAASRYPDKYGVCLDTCHLFAAGYDFGKSDEYKSLMTQIDLAVGISKIKVIHLNDSSGAFGSGTDRHTHIGQGQIHLNGFKLIVNDPNLLGIPMILETPKDASGQWDRMNLATLRSLINKKIS